MRCLLPLLAALTFAPVAHADGFVLFGKRADQSAAVQFGPEASGYRILLLCDDILYEADQGPDRVVRFSAPYTRGTLPRLCAVPANAAIGGLSNAEVLALPGVVLSGGVPVCRGTTTVFDVRDGTAKRFRAEITPQAIVITPDGEREVWAWPTLVGWSLFAVAITVGGVWLIRRRAKRTTPPPGS